MLVPLLVLYLGCYFFGLMLMSENLHAGSLALVVAIHMHENSMSTKHITPALRAHGNTAGTVTVLVLYHVQVELIGYK